MNITCPYCGMTGDKYTETRFCSNKQLFTLYSCMQDECTAKMLDDLHKRVLPTPPNSVSTSRGAQGFSIKDPTGC